MHDHAHCIARALAHVDATCAEDGLQMTPVRRRVLQILLEGHRALGAYEILDRLRAEGLGSQPPVVYRALDFLIRAGFAHRIETLNAFVACTEDTPGHAPAFLICRQCRRVIETPAEPAGGQLRRAAEGAGFSIESAVREAEGLCAECRAAA
ncbi:transcriptional repressor [Paracoccus chinensis]|uniref:Fur family transcriptional regulator, zinc uptake regulator n=1 Tax=Paracoccus chinensis TaxID=525640 RepID=A0A1G9KP66_9RHOB|nr:transcriptional repressor [Paracoccus chinensis]SDL51376.1 Fur family transcriptional regulator, zinc uptake regulator [Paracoccus chinensis]